MITARILRSLKRTVAVLCMALSATSVFTIGRTNAGFSDIEESKDNIWVAGSLDAVPSYIEYFNVVGMNPSQAPDSRITLTNEGSLDYKYNVKFRQTGGDDLLCENLHLVAERDGSAEYEGPLADFNLQGGLFMQAPFDDDNWDFTVTLPEDADATLENLSCEWHFDFLAWQTNLPDASQGFSDEESVGPHKIATGEWLTPGDVIINEVMWMGSDGETSDEWIELKNMTGKDINLSNWNIKQGGTGIGVGAHIEIPNGYSIKANGYFLVTKKKWDDTAVTLTSDLPKSKGYTHVAGMKLEDEGEQLILEDKDDRMIDITPLGAWPAGSNGSLKQSMERNDIPGDGALATNWHTCVSGAANGAPYWDVTGPNFGTPLAANLSPIVMNEFVPNPIGDDDAAMPDGEWIELYNIVDEPIDVANWYFTNSDEDTIAITGARTENGETVVPGQGTLVVYLENSFLDNDHDTLSLYAPHALEVAEDDVREDTVSYEGVAELPEGKSFARFPDGEGIWLDPEATPGESNAMTDEEKEAFQRQAFEACFVGEERLEDVADPMCSPIFLEFIGMISDLEDKTIKGSVLLEILEEIQKEEEEKLLALIHEDGVVTPEEAVLGAVTPVEEETTPEAAEAEAEVEENTEEDDTTETSEPTPAKEEEVVTEETPEAAPVTETPTEEAVKEEEVQEESPAEEAKVEEEPEPEASAPEETTTP